MSPVPGCRREAFAALIAAGHPPILAARGAGYRDLRESRAAARLAEPAVAARIAAAKPAAESPPQPPEPPPPEPPPLPPILTEEEWMEKYGPMLRARALGGA